MASGLLLGRFFIITWIFRLLMFLDNLLLNLCRASYRVFVYTSRITLISGDQIELFTNRVYLILGIALVFIIAYNLLTYIVDPDKMSDKKTGAAAFVKNVIISLTLIVITPMAFVKLYSFQNTIITNGIIANLIMGTPSDGTVDVDEDMSPSEIADEYLDNGARNITASVYSSFILPTDNDFSVLDCPTTKAELASSDLIGAHMDYCDAYYEMLETGSNSAFRDLIDDYEEEFDYYFLVSTAGVLAMLFFFGSYCLELGRRAGRLAILQLLAPIPLAMEVIPGRSGSRQRWLNDVVSTYLDVFIYQATIFIIIFLLQFVGPAVQNLFASAYSSARILLLNIEPSFQNLFYSASIGSAIERTIAIIFLVFGLFKFGKEVPKMIEDLIGIKGAGSFGDVFKRSLAMAGVSAGLIGSTATRFSRNYANTEGTRGQKIMSGVAGATSGIARTLWGARNVHSIKDARNLQSRVNNQVSSAKVRRANYMSRAREKILDPSGNAGWLDTYAQMKRDRHLERSEDRQFARHERWTGKSFEADNERLTALDTLKTRTKGANFKLRDDAEYAEFDNHERDYKLEYDASQREFLRLEASADGLSALKTNYLQNHAGSTDDDFYKWLGQDGNALRDVYSNVIDARNQTFEKENLWQEAKDKKADVEKNILEKKKLNVIRQSAVETLVELKSNPLLSNLTNASGQKYSDLLSKLINDKGELLDSNGNAIDHPTADQVKAIRKMTSEISTAATNQITQINIDRASQRREKELRDARQKNNNNK